ncbi:hypothetical protein [Pseudovibrio exalbescens]|uniref:hypothetical protein n=1 Tax=Pseudovibrio exalbescens TaxID=197461 RepID=UPI0015E0C01F|nr:hypothetical protein [Pseudovibrio exalbescens]
MPHHTDSKGRKIPRLEPVRIPDDQRPTIKEACDYAQKAFTETLRSLERDENSTST